MSAEGTHTVELLAGISNYVTWRSQVEDLLIIKDV